MIITEELPGINSIHDISQNIKDIEKCEKFYELHDMKARAEGLRRTINAFKLMKRSNEKKGIFSKHERKFYGKSTNFTDEHVGIR